MKIIYKKAQYVCLRKGNSPTKWASKARRGRGYIDVHRQILRLNLRVAHSPNQVSKQPPSRWAVRHCNVRHTEPCESSNPRLTREIEATNPGPRWLSYYVIHHGVSIGVNGSHRICPNSESYFASFHSTTLSEKNRGLASVKYRACLSAVI